MLGSYKKASIDYLVFKRQRSLQLQGALSLL
jgi:hypothetical protein